MSNARIAVTIGDERPKINFTLTDSKTGDPLDLSASTTVITGRFRAKGATTTLWQATLTKIDDGEYGQVQLEFPSGGTDQSEGAYELQLAIAYSADIQTIQEVLRFKLTEKFAAVA